MALEMQILGKLCDLPADGIGAKFKYSAENIEEFGTPSGNFSLTIDLPNTATNRAIFGNIEELGTYHLDMPAGTFDPNTAPPARLLQDGNPIFVGNARLLSWTSSAYSIQLFSGNASWFQQMRKNKLGEVDQDGSWRERRWIYNGYDIGLYVQQLAHTGFVDTTLESDVLTQNILTGGDEGTFDATILPWAGTNVNASQNLTDYQAGGGSLQLSGNPVGVTISAEDQVYNLNPNSRYRIFYYHKNRSSLVGTVNITLASIPDASVEVNDGGIDLSVVNTGWQFHTFEFETGNDVAFLLKFESTAPVSGNVDLGIDQVQLIEILSERAIHDGFQALSVPLVAYNSDEIENSNRIFTDITLYGTPPNAGTVSLTFTDAFGTPVTITSAVVGPALTEAESYQLLIDGVQNGFIAEQVGRNVIRFTSATQTYGNVNYGITPVWNIGPTGWGATVTDLLPSKTIDFELLRPATMIWPLLFAHFQNAGYTLKSDWFRLQATGQSEIEPLGLLFNQEEFDIFRTVGDPFFYAYMSAGQTHPQSVGAGEVSLRRVASHDTIVTDLNSEAFSLVLTDATGAAIPYEDGTFDVWKPGTIGAYKLDAIWRAQGNVSNAKINRLYVAIVDSSGNILGEKVEILPLQGEIELGITVFIDDIIRVFSTDIVPNSGLVIAGEYVGTDLQNFDDNYIRISEVTTDGFDLRDYLADITVGELLDSIIQMFNLKMTTDEATRTVYLEPEADFYTDTAQDLTQECDQSAGIKQELLSSKHAKRFEFEYNNDTDDLNIQEFRQLQADGFPYASEQAESVNQTVGGTEKIQPELSASVSKFNLQAGIWYIEMQDDNFPEYKTDWGLRIVSIRARKSLFEHTVKYFQPANFDGVAYDSGELETYDYIEAYFHQRLHSLKYSNDANTVGLYDRFWQNWVRTVNEARILEGEMVLHKQDVNELNQFNKYFAFNPTGAGAPQKILLTELENYDPEGIQRVNFKARTVPAWQQEKQTAFDAENLLYMDGSNDSVSFRYQNDDYFFDDSDFTIGAWANITTPHIGIILAKAGVQLACFASGSSTGFRGILTSIGVGPSTGISYIDYILPYTGPTGWVHVVWVRRGNDATQWQMFINGQEVVKIIPSNTFSGTPDSSGTIFPADTLFLGRRTVGGSFHYDGLMQHVFVAKRAMPAYEIEQIFNNGAGDFPHNGANLMLYCPLNQESGGITNDLASEQVGTLNGYTADELRIDSTNPLRAWQKR